MQFAPGQVWRLHVIWLLAVAALGAVLSVWDYAGAPTDGRGVPRGIVTALLWIGYAVYALVASVLVAIWTPQATPRKVAVANLLALVLAPLATYGLLAPRPDKPGTFWSTPKSPPVAKPPSTPAPRP